MTGYLYFEGLMPWSRRKCFRIFHYSLAPTALCETTLFELKLPIVPLEIVVKRVFSHCAVGVWKYCKSLE